MFRYAIATRLGERDPTADLRGALATRREKNHAALTNPDDIAALLRAIDGYSGNMVTKSALKLPRWCSPALESSGGWSGRNWTSTPGSGESRPRR